MHFLHYFLIIFAACCWGTIGVFTKQSASLHFDIIDMLFIKVTVSTLLLGILLFCTDKKSFRLKSMWDILYFIGTGIVSYVFFSWCYMNAIEHSGMGVAAALLYTAPVIVAVLFTLLFKEKFTKRKTAALCLTVLGCVLVTGLCSGSLQITPLGILWGIGSGVGYALYSICGTYALRRGYSSMTITFYTFLTASVFSLFLVAPVRLAGQVARQSMCPFMILFAVVTATLPYLAYTAGLKKIPASKASVIATIEPVIAVLLGGVFFQETVTLIQVLGMLCILASVVVISLPLKKHA